MNNLKTRTNPAYSSQVVYILLLFIVANALVLWTARLLPFQDLPNHLAEALVFKYNRLADPDIAPFYNAVPWFFPNTFHPVFCSLFPDVESGNKVFYILYASGLLISIYLIIKTLKGNLWYGLLGITFIYNYNVSFGFSGFTISIPTVLFLFYVMLLDTRRERWLNKMAEAFLLVLLYWMHAQVALFGLLLYGFIMLYRYWGNLKVLIIKTVLVPLPVLMMVFIWWSARGAGEKQESTLAFLKTYYITDFIQSWHRRFRLIVFDNFQLHEGWKGLVLAAIIFSLIFIPLIYFKVWKRKFIRLNLSRKELAYPFILLLTSMACYSLLPNKLPGQSPLYERFSTLLCLSLLIFGSVLLKNVQSNGLKYYVLIVAIVYNLLWIEYIYAFNKVNQQFNVAFFSDIQNKERLGGLIYDNKFRGRMLYLHFPSYYLVWKKGLSASMIIDFRFGVVRRGPKGWQIPVYNEWIGVIYKPEPEYKKKLEYILVRGKAPVNPDPNMENFYLFKQSGDWLLYKNKNRIAAVE